MYLSMMSLAKKKPMPSSNLYPEPLAKKSSQHEKSIVFDLDETLVKAVMVSEEEARLLENKEKVEIFTVSGEVHGSFRH